MAQEIEITFRVEPEQAAALLKFLRRVGFDAVAEALDDDGEKIRALGEASERVRVALLREAIDCMLDGDIDTGKAVLRDYINATIGFDELGSVTQKSPKSLMRMLGPSGNPQASNLFAIVAYLQKSEGLRLTTRTARR